MMIDGIEVTVRDFADMTEAEIKKYIAHIQNNGKDNPKGGRLSKLTISPTPSGEVSLFYEFAMPKFERIRRITGKPIK